MAIIKCKMCGGDLDYVEGASTAECEYCGSVQTIPKADDEKKLTLFARANRLRLACEFDKAAGIYESIVADFPEEAEAYWGLVLCKYGIEYVDDPANGKKIPTCHRSSFESILEDSDFEQALENADSVARRVYREEAKQIEEIRKGIIAVSANEEPYDIFICYKETAENGERTLDSVLAQDVYDALTDKGYRVFFSRISLEDKLGVEYEPYIFAALNSAKIMLAFGTDYEYFNAVWVKNEWSRFLKLMAKDKTRYLIPCYKGIDAYDMPREFAKLQAQDLGKVGAVQDLLRGVEKLLSKETKSVKETLVIQQSAPSAPGTDSLLERAFMFLEDGEWDNADAYCEKVLDITPQNAQAYLGKLLAELKIKKPEDLQDYADWPAKNKNYQKALRFADRELQSMLQFLEAQYTLKKKAEEEKRKALEEQLALKRKAKEEERRNKRYICAIKLLEKGEKEEAYGLLKRLSGYKEADALVKTIKNDVLFTLAPVARNGKWGYINEAGEMVIAPRFDKAWGFASNGLAVVERNGKQGYINEAGEMVIQPQFDGARSFKSNGLAGVERNGKWGYINEAGGMVIQPQFDEASYFESNGLACVRLGNKWGWINEAGGMVIQPQFDDASYFDSNGLAVVKLDGKRGYINEAGEMVIAPQFDEASSFASNGLASVKRNDKWGYINEAGEMVIAPQFDNACPFAIIFRSKVEHRKEKARQRAAQQADWRAAGVCQHCGGTFVGLFNKKCSKCGKIKSY